MISHNLYNRNDVSNTKLHQGLPEGTMAMKESQLRVVGYFFKMCYDICTSPMYTVSNKSGFETIIGLFNNKNEAEI